MFVIELIACAIAWGRGWKGWALIPVMIPLVAGFLMGAAAESEADLEAMLVPGLVLEVICMVALIIMAIVGHKTTADEGEAPMAEAHKQLQ